MATDLTKMVEDWWKAKWGQQLPATIFSTHRLLSAMAAKIEANREEIEMLKAERNGGR